MSCSNNSPAKWGCVILACFLTALSIQTLIALIGAAISIGNGYSMWFAVMHIYSWPVFFLCLFLAILMMVTCMLKRCCGNANTTEKSDTDNTSSTGEHC